MDNRVKLLFEDMSIASVYQFLDEAKDKEELKKIAEEKGIKLPSKDISIFKCRYAMVDEQNKNKCTLPKKEVKKALETLTGKAIDKDHFRKATVGHWLDASLDNDDIYAYGCFWKSNFPEEYEEVKKRLSEGKLKISFEAWGDRVFRADGSYDLTNIEFAGGALLFDTQPAFPDAEVIEFSTLRDKTLEFAKIIEATEKMEEAKLDFNYDMSNIARVVYQHDCPTCKAKGYQDVQSIDFENSKIKHKCLGCGEITETDLTPTSVIKKQGKKPKPVDVTGTQSNEIDNTTKNVNKSHKEGGLEVDELLKKYNKASPEEFIKYIDESLTALTVKDQEIATLKKELEDSKIKIENSGIELEKVKVEAKKIEDELNKRLEAEKAAFIKARKDELGEDFIKELALTDEDITNDLKFENAKLKKELKIAKATPIPPTKGGLEAGAQTGGVIDPVFEKQKAIHKKAHGEQ
jgi:hypothetical protein